VSGAGPGEDDGARWLDEARRHERAGRYDEAVRACEAALGADPGSGDAHLTRASLHDRAGERVSALEHYRRAARAWPERLAVARLVEAAGGGGFEAPLRAEVVDLFERYAPRFDEHLVTNLRYVGHEVLPATVARALGVGSASWRILDLGCGTGLCGPALRSLAAAPSGRLEGVDLSPACAARAAERGCYDEVWVGDLLYALCCGRDESYDLLVAADVLGYLGRLEPALTEARRVLRPGGALAFTVEAAREEGSARPGGVGFAMGPSRRFAYSARYLADVREGLGLDALVEERAVLRVEGGASVEGHVVVWRTRAKCDST
jgi:predicted TPR repeat methyltransferase